uniref:Dxs1 n=1 Tax=Arundo donax TaxID=35708 RepID=A0A0A9EES8_ARUDO
MSESRYPALFMASYACPAVMAPSPITATTLFFPPLRSLPTAIPSAAEMVVELCPVPKQSYSLSARFVNPASPFVCRIVDILSRRPVRILCGYDWWPTSQRMRSWGALKT